MSNRATRNLDVNRVLFMAFNSDSEFSTLNSGKATELCTQMAEVGNLHIYSRWALKINIFLSKVFWNLSNGDVFLDISNVLIDFFLCNLFREYL